MLLVFEPVASRLPGSHPATQSELKNDHKGRFTILAGVAGIEPANAGTKIQCLTTWLHPNIYCQFYPTPVRTKIQCLSPVIFLTENSVDPDSQSSPFADAQTQTSLRPCTPTNMKQFMFALRGSPLGYTPSSKHFFGYNNSANELCFAVCRLENFSSRFTKQSPRLAPWFDKS